MNISNIKSYIINLEKDINSDKYLESIKQLKTLNINPERFNAIYVDDINSDYIKSIIYPSVNHTIINKRSLHNQIGSNGAIGCYLSHIKL